MNDASNYQWDYDFLPESDKLWIRVEGGRLGQPIHVRLGQNGARYFVAAIHIENGQEVKGTDLRFPLTAIAEQIARDSLTPAEPDLSGVRRMKEIPIAIEDWAFSRIHLDEATALVEPKKPRGRGAKPPSPDELRAFAAAYLEELRNRPRGAIGRAAIRFHMHRVTGYKWLARCRELGIIPKEDS